MCPNIADGLVNSVDPDQTAASEPVSTVCSDLSVSIFSIFTVGSLFHFKWHETIHAASYISIIITKQNVGKTIQYTAYSQMKCLNHNDHYRP